MSTPRQERGILADILARCSNCNIKDHKTQMFPFSSEDSQPGDAESWLCHVCAYVVATEDQDDDGQADDHYSNGDEEPPTTPSPRSRRSTRN